MSPFDRTWVSCDVKFFPERFITHRLGWFSAAAAGAGGGASRCCKRLFLRLGFSVNSSSVSIYTCGFAPVRPKCLALHLYLFLFCVHMYMYLCVRVLWTLVCVVLYLECD